MRAGRALNTRQAQRAETLPSAVLCQYAAAAAVVFVDASGRPSRPAIASGRFLAAAELPVLESEAVEQHWTYRQEGRREQG